SLSLSQRPKHLLSPTAAPNYPHKLTKAAGPLARRPSRLGRLELHGGMAAAHRSLRIFRQSRRPPRRGEAGMRGGFCSLEWALGRRSRGYGATLDTTNKVAYRQCTPLLRGPDRRQPSPFGAWTRIEPSGQL